MSSDEAVGNSDEKIKQPQSPSEDIGSEVLAEPCVTDECEPRSPCDGGKGQVAPAHTEGAIDPLEGTRERGRLRGEGTGIPGRKDKEHIQADPFRCCSVT